METVVVQLTDENAYKRLLELETLQFIKVLKSNTKKPSERFAGKLNIPEKEYQDFRQYLKNARNEWDRSF